MRTILLKDIKEAPGNLLTQLRSNFIHRINIIDIKGLQDFKDNKIYQGLSLIQASAGTLLRLTLRGKNKALDGTSLPQNMEDLVKDHYGQLCDKMWLSRIPFFSANLLAHCIELLYISSLHYSDFGTFKPETYQQSIDYIVRQFYSAFRVQFILAALFRKNNGVLKGTKFDVMKQLSSIEMVLFERSLRESEDLSHLRDGYV